MNNCVTKFTNVWSNEKLKIVSKLCRVNFGTIKYCQPKNKPVIISYAKQSGLRSMHHIKGTEREIIETYKTILTHDIWGNPQKLSEWATKKFEEITNRNYISDRLDITTVQSDRNECVKAWAELINNNFICNKDPFLKLKVIKSITEHLKENNAQLPPPINKNVFRNTIQEIKKNGQNFKKTYLKLMRDFDTTPGIETKEIAESGIRGKWFSIKVPNWADAICHPGRFKKINEFIAILSQGSNWCTRNHKAISKNFIGSDFHIFIDNKGKPQICMVGIDSNGGKYRYVKGNNQYAPFPQQYKPILKSFIEHHKLDNAIVGETDIDVKRILDICE